MPHRLQIQCSQGMHPREIIRKKLLGQQLAGRFPTLEHNLAEKVHRVVSAEASFDSRGPADLVVRLWRRAYIYRAASNVAFAPLHRRTEPINGGSESDKPILALVVPRLIQHRILDKRLDNQANHQIFRNLLEEPMFAAHAKEQLQPHRAHPLFRDDVRRVTAHFRFVHPLKIRVYLVQRIIKLFADQAKRLRLQYEFPQCPY